MGPTWVLSAPDGPHVGPMNLAIRDVIAILIKDMLFDKYKIEVSDKEIDGLMGIQLIDINIGCKLVLYACYSPPKTSHWGYGPNAFFAHLLSFLYFHFDADPVLLRGFQWLCGEGCAYCIWFGWWYTTHNMTRWCKKKAMVMYYWNLWRMADLQF